MNKLLNKSLKNQGLVAVGSNFETEAINGMKSISKMVEHISDGPLMTNLLTRSTGSNLVNVGRAGVANQVQQNVGRNVMQSNVTKWKIALRVTRNSRNISETLPVPLFCPVSIVDSYQTVLNLSQTLPTGVTVALSFVNNRTLRLTFTQGLNVDTVDIQTNSNISYPVLLEMLKTDLFGGIGFKYTAGDGNFTTQFGCHNINYGLLTPKGISDTDSDPVDIYKTVDQEQDNIINVDMSYEFNPRRYLVLGMADTIVNPGDASINLSFFVSYWSSGFDFLNEEFSCK